MTAREDGGEQLLDHVVLADNHSLQFLLHHLPVPGKFLEDFSQALRFFAHSYPAGV
jgi:hypothetical protein